VNVVAATHLIRFSMQTIARKCNYLLAPAVTRCGSLRYRNVAARRGAAKSSTAIVELPCNPD